MISDSHQETPAVYTIKIKSQSQDYILQNIMNSIGTSFFNLQFHDDF